LNTVYNLTCPKPLPVQFLDSNGPRLTVDAVLKLIESLGSAFIERRLYDDGSIANYLWIALPDGTVSMTTMTESGIIDARRLSENEICACLTAMRLRDLIAEEGGL